MGKPWFMGNLVGDNLNTLETDGLVKSYVTIEFGQYITW